MLALARLNKITWCECVMLVAASCEVCRLEFYGYSCSEFVQVECRIHERGISQGDSLLLPRVCLNTPPQMVFARKPYADFTAVAALDLQLASPM